MKTALYEKLETFFVAFIQRRGPEYELSPYARLFLFGLHQLSKLYYGVVQTRLFFYKIGLFRHQALGCQVISVGNLTVGGTGKTPVVEVFARELARAGRKVAVLSRGYKKKEPGFWSKALGKLTLAEMRRPPRVVSDGTRVLLDSEMSGDEPFMLASNLPGVCVLVDKNRVKSGRYAIARHQCDTLILDDGFQYMALKHRVEIVLVDRTNPFGNGHVLPRGILREPIRNIRRANFVFVTKSDPQGDEALQNEIRAWNARAEIIECRHCPRFFRHVASGAEHPLSFVDKRKIVVLSGIAMPSGFEGELERLGAVILKRHRFADHHRYGREELEVIVRESRELGADALVTTEKDAVRFPAMDFPGDLPVFYLRVDIDILSGAESFEQCIARICFRA
jgi:tetraacyldisaccharide 4'-kinase